MKKDLPAADLRSNVGTWAIPNFQLPALSKQMLDLLAPEKFDPDFKGQYLQTTYFDTRNFDFRKARLNKEKYVTIRIRCYAPTHGAGTDYPDGTYAISAKTESKKFRVQVASDYAETLLYGGITPSILAGVLDPDIIARVADLSGGLDIIPVVTICFNRYAAEDDKHRLTLDIGVCSDNGKCYPSNVLEQKSTNKDATPLIDLPVKPIKLSKFLWATS